MLKAPTRLAYWQPLRSQHTWVRGESRAVWGNLDPSGVALALGLEPSLGDGRGAGRNPLRRVLGLVCETPFVTLFFCHRPPLLPKTKGASPSI